MKPSLVSPTRRTRTRLRLAYVGDGLVRNGPTLMTGRLLLGYDDTGRLLEDIREDVLDRVLGRVLDCVLGCVLDRVLDCVLDCVLDRVLKGFLEGVLVLLLVLSGIHTTPARSLFPRHLSTR